MSRLLPVFVLVIGILVALSCQRPSPPERPLTVPPAAVWVGGDKGGCWIDCTLAKSENANRCTVYDERTGEVWATGLYVQKSDGEPVQPANLTYNFFDGEVIGLTGGRLLVPLLRAGTDDPDGVE